MTSAVTVEAALLIGSALVLASIATMLVFKNLGIPALALFLAVGMVAGSDGLGGIHFDDKDLARSLGIVALVVILFSGGLDTDWERSKPVFPQAVGLATLGTFLTACFVGLLTYFVFGGELLPHLLLGAIISSTDAAAVFSILRIRKLGLPKHLSATVELESATNDPMAVFLTVGLLQYMSADADAAGISLLFVKQMGLGAVLGLAFGKGMVLLVNRMKFPSDGIALVFTVAFAFLAFSVTDRLGGSGFLAVYITGLIAGNSNLKLKRSLIRFWDGQAWICQIGMFLVLGLLVFPTELPGITREGLMIAAFLMLVARPAAVFLTLSFSKLGFREKGFLSWVGLRGAVPIILATFPFSAGIPEAGYIFNIVFFIVLTSALLQGSTLHLAARIFGLEEPEHTRANAPIELTPSEGFQAESLDFILPRQSSLVGKAIVDLGLPPDTAIVMISRQDRFLIPGGGTQLKEGDVITLIADPVNIGRIKEIFSALHEEQTESKPVTPPPA